MVTNSSHMREGSASSSQWWVWEELGVMSLSAERPKGSDRLTAPTNDEWQRRAPPLLFPRYAHYPRLVFSLLQSPGPYRPDSVTGGARPNFDDGGGKAPKFQNFPKIIRVPICENRNLRFRGGGTAPLCIRACCIPRLLTLLLFTTKTRIQDLLA